jgi:hypothetical protein
MAVREVDQRMRLMPLSSPLAIPLVGSRIDGNDPKAVRFLNIARANGYVSFWVELS